MDDSLQSIDHRTPYDTRGGAKRHAEIPGGFAHQTRNKQFLRWYVQGVQHGLCERPNRTWVLVPYRTSAYPASILQKEVKLTRFWILVQIQGTNIRHYYNYILARAKAFKDTRIDWVRDGVGRLKRQSIDKGLLRETEAVQNQINNLLKCDVGSRR